MRIIGGLIVLMAFGVAVAGPLLGIAYALDSYTCSSKAKVMGVEYSYSLFTDCMIKTDGRWEPLKWQRSARIKD